MVEINLPGDPSGLILRIEDDGWTEMSLRTDSGRKVLGSDKRSVVVSRLLDALTKPPKEEVAGSIGGIKVQWVLTLAEEHSTLYKGVAGNLVNLYVELADTSRLGPIRLTEENKMEWVKTLGSMV